MIYTATIGYFNFDSVTGQRVRVITDFKGKKEIKGSFCVQSVHDSVLKSRSLENIWIDVGATSRNSVLEMGIKPGNSVVFDAPFCLLNGGKRALGKAFDNRASCAILLDSIYLLLKNPPPYDVFFSFSTQEEFILRGAHTVFNTIKRLNDAVPKISISLDIGICCVTSTSDPQTLTMEMGKGPGIKIRDKSNVSHYSHVTPPRLVAILEQMAYLFNMISFRVAQMLMFLQPNIAEYTPED